MSIRFSIDADDVTRTYEVKRSVVTFGRSGASTVTIDDPALSRTHCQFEVENDICYIRDLNSKNGTFVEDQRVNRLQLEEGDVVKIGNARITFHGKLISGLATEGVKTAHWTSRLFGAKLKPRAEEKGGGDEADALQLRRLLSMVRNISAELEPERVLSRVLDAAIEFAEAERGFLVLLDGTVLRIPVARDFWKKDIATPAFELSRSIALAVVRRGKPIVTDDASGDDRFEEAASVYDLQIRSVICVPLRSERRVIGAIYLDNRFSRGIFDEGDLEALALFAEQAALAVENSHHFDMVRESSERWEKVARARQRESDQLKAQVAQLERAEGLRFAYPDVIGRSEAMTALLRMADRVTEVDLPILIAGESGTGKELLARAIHANSSRRDRPFVAVDAGALASGLAEVELFGSQRGAFTGSDQSREGLLEVAHGGTLFLDEVADMSPEVQKSLLRVLETGEVRRIGAQESQRVDLRILSATNHDLEEEIGRGRFREDLYYRLKGVQIDVPPLRERVEDLPLLLEAFLADAEPSLEIDAEAWRALTAYSWPGNVRELRTEAERMRLSGRRRLGLDDLSPQIAVALAPQAPLRPLKDEVEELEIRLILSALEETDGNKTKASEILGLSRLGLRKKMTRYGLEP